jgi:predicted Zn-dependent protease
VAAGVNASEAYLQLSRAYVGLNRTEEALRTLHAGVERYPDSLLLNSSLGMAYLLAQDPARALGFLERCEKLSPRDAATKLHLAQALAGLGRGSEAARKQSEAFRLDPKLARQERK